MVDEIVNDLAMELKIAEGIDNDTLNSEVIPLVKIKVKSAYREVENARRYPKSYTEAMIERDMKQFYPQIKAISMFDYNHIGAEGEEDHSENGVHRSYVERDSLFSGIIPLGGVS